MMEIDLGNLSLSELKKLRQDVDSAIADFETRKRKEALEAITATAQEYGFSLQELDLKSGPKAARRGKNPPKYRHPENPDVTWSGRGRQPGWIKRAMASGQSLDELAI
ncbi:H-NS histone family protein [Tropicimonas marinistellae]|uniref:H-NS histone family protein n=1 Tax=Tropicimonas marinistellae TaxID=1739787 RepID=UPI000830F0A0|nr:H-NS histone family protein [Tropicimonas marinistellae]